MIHGFYMKYRPETSFYLICLLIWIQGYLADDELTCFTLAPLTHVNIGCPEGSRILVTSAIYGASPFGLCHGTGKDCTQEVPLPLRCCGRRTCTFDVRNRYLTKCLQPATYYQVYYMCVKGEVECQDADVTEDLPGAGVKKEDAKQAKESSTGANPQTPARSKPLAARNNALARNRNRTSETTSGPTRNNVLVKMETTTFPKLDLILTPSKESTKYYKTQTQSPLDKNKTTKKEPVTIHTFWSRTERRQIHNRNGNGNSPYRRNRFRNAYKVRPTGQWRGRDRTKNDRIETSSMLAPTAAVPEERSVSGYRLRRPFLGKQDTITVPPHREIPAPKTNANPGLNTERESRNSPRIENENRNYHGYRNREVGYRHRNRNRLTSRDEYRFRQRNDRYRNAQSMEGAENQDIQTTTPPKFDPVEAIRMLANIAYRAKSNVKGVNGNFSKETSKQNATQIEEQREPDIQKPTDTFRRSKVHFKEVPELLGNDDTLRGVDTKQIQVPLEYVTQKPPENRKDKEVNGGVQIEDVKELGGKSESIPSNEQFEERTENENHKGMAENDVHEEQVTPPTDFDRKHENTAPTEDVTLDMLVFRNHYSKQDVKTKKPSTSVFHTVHGEEKVRPQFREPIPEKDLEISTSSTVYQERPVRITEKGQWQPTTTDAPVSTTNRYDITTPSTPSSKVVENNLETSPFGPKDGQKELITDYDSWEDRETDGKNENDESFDFFDFDAYEIEEDIKDTSYPSPGPRSISEQDSDTQEGKTTFYWDGRLTTLKTWLHTLIPDFRKPTTPAQPFVNRNHNENDDYFYNENPSIITKYNMRELPMVPFDREKSREYSREKLTTLKHGNIWNFAETASPPVNQTTTPYDILLAEEKLATDFTDISISLGTLLAIAGGEAVLFLVLLIVLGLYLKRFELEPRHGRSANGMSISASLKRLRKHYKQKSKKAAAYRFGTNSNIPVTNISLGRPSLPSWKHMKNSAKKLQRTNTFKYPNRQGEINTVCETIDALPPSRPSSARPVAVPPVVPPPCMYEEACTAFNVPSVDGRKSNCPSEGRRYAAVIGELSETINKVHHQDVDDDSPYDFSPDISSEMYTDESSVEDPNQIMYENLNQHRFIRTESRRSTHMDQHLKAFAENELEKIDEQIHILLHGNSTGLESHV